MNARRFVIASAMLLGALAFRVSALTPEEATQHIGKEGAVNGVAVQVSEADGNVYVNLGAKYPNHTFSAMVAKVDVPAVGLDYLKSMEGKPVSIVGRIISVRGKPQIQVLKKDQIILTVHPEK